MLMPAAIAVAVPAMKAACGSWVYSATEKIGAIVESDPSIRPVRAGWTRWRRNVCCPVTTIVYQSVRKSVEHKERLTKTVRAS
jgi:hypothetical protein